MHTDFLNEAQAIQEELIAIRRDIHAHPEPGNQEFRTSGIIQAYLKDLGIELIDFKLEFGRFNGEILLADEISPDTCRFWDSKTGEKLDKDRFRRDLGHVEDAYQEILRRLMGGHEE